ncbi:GDSL-type esterase/lipase family protein [Patulibacter minatonensis]|uniref:GDSL-type esterase/lipase family protein n=1 Tax=Patulibacter minatonensis TaxID=298163 RepID=UPI00047EB5E6
MRPADVTRRALRVVAATRRRARTAVGRGERPAPVLAWRTQRSAPGGTILAGDSLASRFPRDLLHDVAPDVLVRGWPGERTSGLASRVDELLERHPAVVVLQTGTNDLLRGSTDADVHRAHSALLDACARTAPHVRLVVMALPPITSRRADPGAVARVNALLREAARARGHAFVDTHAPLSSARGTPRPGTTTDGVHLSREGYRCVAEHLSATLREPGPPTERMAPPQPHAVS